MCRKQIHIVPVTSFSFFYSPALGQFLSEGELVLTHRCCDFQHKPAICRAHHSPVGLTKDHQNMTRSKREYVQKNWIQYTNWSLWATTESILLSTWMLDLGVWPDIKTGEKFIEVRVVRYAPTRTKGEKLAQASWWLKILNYSHQIDGWHMRRWLIVICLGLNTEKKNHGLNLRKSEMVWVWQMSCKILAN